MTDAFWLGMTTVLCSGMLTGSFPLPMKYTRHWRWENTWLVFSFLSLVMLPVLLARGYAPPLQVVYRAIPARDLLLVAGFGLTWGIAQTTFGIGIRATGMAFAFAVVSGLSCLFGSLIPLLVFSPASLLHPRGTLLLVSMPILFLGLIFYATAGRRRETEQHAEAPQRSRENFKTGMAICIFTGICGASINLGFAFSGAVVHRGLQLGGSPTTSTYPVWVLVLGAGFVPNLVYCLHLLQRNKTSSLFFHPGCFRDMLLALLMAFIWLAGIVGYGIGATLVGKYGTSLGFALLNASQILTANALGIFAGEWKKTSVSTKRVLIRGTVLIVASVVVLNLGGLTP